MTTYKHIEVVPYNPAWPLEFEKEAAKIKAALSDNCLRIHHIGSTSVSGLSAKPIIDIILECKDNKNSIKPLENIGYEYRGEFNIPFRNYFCKRDQIRVNLHCYEQGNPELNLNLKFRDYLRTHPDAKAEYEQLKYNLLKQESSFKKNNSIFTGYNLGKDQFIRKILQKLDLTSLRISKSVHYAELEAAKTLRQKYIFDQAGIKDPYLWTFESQDHIHFAFYKGVQIIGYAHIQLWPKNRAALRIIAIDENYRNNGYGGEFLKLCEKWLKLQGYKSLHIESSPKAYSFYKKYGYIEMPFDDPDKYESDPNDIPIGKIL